MSIKQKINQMKTRETRCSEKATTGNEEKKDNFLDEQAQAVVGRNRRQRSERNRVGSTRNTSPAAGSSARISSQAGVVQPGRVVASQPRDECYHGDYLRLFVPANYPTHYQHCYHPQMMHLISARNVNMSSLNASGFGRRQSIAFHCILVILLFVLPTVVAIASTDQSSSVVEHINLTLSTDASRRRQDRLDASRKNLSSLTGAWDAQHLDASKVIVFNLSANYLDVLVAHGFSDFTSLKCLDIAGNKVRQIEDNAFADLEGLVHLNLSGNRLAILQDETFRGLLSLQQLDLSFNNLSKIAPGALELASLSRLEIAGNAHLANGKASLFLATGKRLQSMDATGIGVGRVPSALTHSIRTLRLASNRIASISRGEMDTYPLLQLLDLSGNQLVDVEEDALGRLEMLTILYLTRNYLTSIPHSLPEKLQILHLEHNRIGSLRPVDLDGLDQLEVLLLNGNQIRTITNGAFRQMTALVSLDLSLNSFTELPAGLLAGPLGLRVLRLGYLNVSMPAGAKETVFPLPATEHLITLDVRSSPALARQWLADIAALAAARELQELDLSNCGIQHLPIDLFHYLPQLRSLHLVGNELNCTDLEWLAEWMRRQEIGEFRDIYCQSPGELWGTLLIDLQNAEETVENKAGKQEDDVQGAKTWLKAINATMMTQISRRNLFMKNSSAPDESKRHKTLRDGHERSTVVPTEESEATKIKPMSLVTYNVDKLPTRDDGREWNPHPGMYLLIIGVMGAVLVIITLSARISNRRADGEQRQELRVFQVDQQDLIDVTSLSSVTELW